jgi:hypothetical protein
MQLPVGRQFARDDPVVASLKGNVTTGTWYSPVAFTGPLVAFRLGRPWKASHTRDVEQAQGASATRAAYAQCFCLRSDDRIGSRFDSNRTGGERLACEVQLLR